MQALKNRVLDQKARFPTKREKIQNEQEHHIEQLGLLHVLLLAIEATLIDTIPHFYPLYILVISSYQLININGQNMNCPSQESEYDSSEDEAKIYPARMPENSQRRANLNPKIEQNEEATLKPKFHYGTKDQERQQLKDKNPSKVLANASKVTVASRKNLMDAYTFKRQTSHRLRKHDPVSLYSQARQSWNNTKFLRNRADEKEGRKLDLEKRNKVSKCL